MGETFTDDFLKGAAVGAGVLAVIVVFALIFGRR